METRVNLPVNELLAGLAEEASELAQAALKLRRAYDGTNPTPMPHETCYDHLLEEIADVWLYIDQLPVNMKVVGSIKRMKLERWLRRLEHSRKREG